MHAITIYLPPGGRRASRRPWPADPSGLSNERSGDRDGRSHRGGRRGRRGPGPDGFGGPGGPGFGPGHGRRRARRGHLRVAVLALLAEAPMHGYAIIGALTEHSGGLWSPSPGSVYPVLSLLEEEGLVASEESEGRKTFSLTAAGRSYVEEHADLLRDPFTPDDLRQRDRARGLFEAVRSLGGAAREVARGGSDAQVQAARTVLDDARRALYRILAEAPSAEPAEPAKPAEPAEPAEREERSEPPEHEPRDDDA